MTWKILQVMKVSRWCSFLCTAEESLKWDGLCCAAVMQCSRRGTLALNWDTTFPVFLWTLLSSFCEA